MGCGCGTRVPSSARRIRHSRNVFDALGSFFWAGGRRRIMSESPCRIRYSALAIPASSPIRSAVTGVGLGPNSASSHRWSDSRSSRLGAVVMVELFRLLTVTVNRRDPGSGAQQHEEGQRPVAWDFSTEPEFEAKLKWMRSFVADE